MREPALLSRRSATRLPLAALLGVAASSRQATAEPTSDPVMQAIAEHKTLRARLSALPDRGDDDPTFQAAVDEEEAAIQALGDMVPATIAAAAAQLAYMAEVEGGYGDRLSPLLRTVLSVARGLATLPGGAA